MLSILENIWKTLVSWYDAYASAVHSIFPGQLGDLVVYLIDLAVVIVIVKLVATYAFKSREN